MHENVIKDLVSEWNTGWRRNLWVECRSGHAGVERWQRTTEVKMSEWDTGERVESVFQGNVVSLVALELATSKFVHDNSMYHLGENNYRNAWCRFLFFKLILICNDCNLMRFL